VQIYTQCNASLWRGGGGRRKNEEEEDSNVDLEATVVAEQAGRCLRMNADLECDEVRRRGRTRRKNLERVNGLVAAIHLWRRTMGA